MATATPLNLSFSFISLKKFLKNGVDAIIDNVIIKKLLLKVYIPMLSTIELPDSPNITLKYEKAPLKDSVSKNTHPIIIKTNV